MVSYESSLFTQFAKMKMITLNMLLTSSHHGSIDVNTVKCQFSLTFRAVLPDTSLMNDHRMAECVHTALSQKVLGCIVQQGVFLLVKNICTTPLTLRYRLALGHLDFLLIGDIQPNKSPLSAVYLIFHAA